MNNQEIRQDEWMFWRGVAIKFDIPQGVATPIYCVGDSHIINLVESCPYIFTDVKNGGKGVHYISATAYSMSGELPHEYIINCSEKIPPGSPLLISFGEIDCRHYIPKTCKKNGLSPSSEARKISIRYINGCLKKLSVRFRVIVLGPYICPNDRNHEENPFDDILEAKSAFNDELKNFCVNNGIAFVPTFYVGQEKNWDLYGRDHYFNDTSHLGPCMVPLILESVTNFNWKGFETE